MQSLRNTLFVSLLLQVCLAAAIFGAAEGAPLAFITLPIALFSIVVIDLTGWLKPPRLMLNLIALSAVGLAVAEFRNDGESRLLAGGHLIVYLTWTFLLQQKDLRRMWWIFALSVLQVAMGAVLTVQPWFGAALFVYTVISVGTMSLLSLTRAALLIDPNLLNAGTKDDSPDAQADAIVPALSFVQNSVRTDEQGRWLSPRFILGGAMTFVLSLALGIAFFVLTPRVWIGNLNLMADGSTRSARTGFTDTVTLGETAQLMESNELVMEVEVRSSRDGQLLADSELANVFGVEPLFRGMCLENYDIELKSWQGLGRYRTMEMRDDPRAPLQASIRLQPLDTTTLFFPGQIIGASTEQEVSVGTPEALLLHRWTTTLLRSDETTLGKAFTYTVNVFPPGVDLNPQERENSRQFVRRRGVVETFGELLSTPSRRISALAQQVVREAGINPLEHAETAAGILESYLRDSPEYQYSFNLSIDDPTIDPIEDFVFNRKSGHCEYFASALAMMLRGVGIPSRLVSGFKGGDFNDKTGKFEIRSLHAHAWVEAFVDGAWKNFDPTPGARDEAVARREKERADANPLLNETRSMWFQGMNYSKSQQEQLVYAPIRDLAGWGKSLFAGLMEGKLEFPGFGNSGASSVTGGRGRAVGILLISLAVIGLIGLAWIGRIVARRWKFRARERRKTQRRAITVEFYARFLKLMQRCGLAETPTLTPREFALQAEQRFAERLAPSQLTGSATRLAELFYTVRFGGEALSEEQLGRVEQELVTLENCLVRGTVA